MSLSSTQSYRKTAQTHRIGLSTDKPDAADVLVGTLYFSTDIFTLERSNGTVWESYAGTGGSGGSGDVTGPASSIVDNLATYADTTGKLIKDGGTSAIALNNAIAQNSTQIGDLAAIPYTTVSATSLSNARQLIASTNIAFDTATAGQLKISSIGGTGNVVGPASSVDSSVPAYDGTTGKLIKDLGLLIFGSSELRPVNDATIDLGAVSNQWKDLYLSSNVNAGGLGSTPINASNLTSGTVADARLSTNVPLKDQANTFTANQTISGTLTVNNSGGNVALKNAANTFTFNQAIYAVSPNWRLYDTAATTDQHNVQMSYAGNVFKIQTLNDAFAVQTNLLSLTRSGDATIANNLTVNGTGGNVACKDQANTFTQDQRIEKDYPTLFIHDSLQPADQRLFIIRNISQELYFNARNDASSASHGGVRISRAGDLKADKDIYEKQRTTPMGHWIDVAFSASNYFGGGGGTWTVSAGNVTSHQYALVGKTLMIAFRIDNGTVAGTVTDLNVYLPSGMTARRGLYQPCLVHNGGAWTAAMAITNSGATVVTINRVPFANFSTGATSLSGLISLPMD